MTTNTIHQAESVECPKNYGSPPDYSLTPAGECMWCGSHEPASDRMVKRQPDPRYDARCALQDRADWSAA